MGDAAPPCVLLLIGAVAPPAILEKGIAGWPGSGVEIPESGGPYAHSHGVCAAARSDRRAGCRHEVRGQRAGASPRGWRVGWMAGLWRYRCRNALQPFDAG